MNYLVIGAGRCGQAIAYDLAVHGDSDRVMLFDTDIDAARVAQHRLYELCKEIPGARNVRFPLVQQMPGMRQFDCVISSAPFKNNLDFAEQAIRDNTSFCDLGGNTEVVQAQLDLNQRAIARDISIIPDCGMAPGLVNIIASIGINQVGDAKHVRIKCGGLPLYPEPPLNYAPIFNMDGLINEYSGKAEVLRNGKLCKIDALTEVDLWGGLGRTGPFETFVTSGGSSMAPRYFEGKLDTYAYKTARYLGHVAKMRVLKDLGFFSQEEIELDRDIYYVRPSEVTARILEKSLPKFDGKDIMVAQIDITNDLGYGIVYRLVDLYDSETGFTAMERTTGFTTGAIAFLAAKGAIEPGARTPEMIGFQPAFLDMLHKRGIQITAENICAREDS